MPINHSKMVLRYAPLALLLSGLAGCAPAYMPEPIYSAPPPQAMPLMPLPEPMPQQIPMPRPIHQPQSYNSPPTVTPIEARTKIVAESLPESSTTKKPAGPAVTYIPEKQQASTSPTQSSTQKPVGVPFWDQGKVQVEVLDMPAEKLPAPSSSAVPPQTGFMSSSTTNGSPSFSSPLQTSSSSPAVAVLLKQANNELSVGKADRAATTLERALRIAPNDANLWLRLAEVNEQLGNKAQASSMARKALDLAPDDVALRLRAQRLAN